MNGVHVIHNPERKDRLATLIKEATDQTMPYRLMPARMEPTAPFIGISLSHRNIVKYAKASGFKEVWIGEDDMKFLGPGAFHYYVRNKPADFDLYLSGLFFGDIAPDHTVKDFCGMTLYCVHSRFYDTFLKINPNENIDRALAGLGRYVVCDPIVTTQYGGFSDHKAHYVENYNKFLEGRNLYKGPI